MQDNDSNAHHSSAPQADSLPFFARFLEGQNNAEQSAATKNHPTDLAQTLKYPSDRDEWEPFMNS